MKHKLLQSLMLIASLLTSAHAFAHDFEAQNSDGKTIYYNITSSTDKTCEVTYLGSYYNSYSHEYMGSIVIPEIVTYKGTTYGVTSIGNDAFRCCNRLTSVTIPNSVTSIGNDAFYGCSGLTSIVIPNSVTSIGDDAFYGCSGLTSIVIPNSVTSIDEGAFSDCNGLTSVTIGNSVTSIGSSAFTHCSGLISIKVEKGNSVYDSRNNCNAIIETSTNTLITGCKNTSIPEGVTSIGIYAFNGCTGLTSVTIPNSVTSIGHGAFYNCPSLTSFIFNAENCITMGSSSESVFGPYNKLSSVTIGEKVKNIPSRAFGGCSGLTSVTMGNSVTSIGHGAFGGCSGLTSVTIPNSVTSIGKNAFVGCSGLTSVTIPNGVTSIGSRAFEGCSGLTSITIPNGVTSIETGTFYECYGLTSITIPSSVTSIGQYAFEDCYGLTSVNISNLEAWCKIDFVDSYNNPLYFAKNLYLNGELLTELVIPDSINEIKDYTFYNCYGLTSITIPNNVTSIGDYAFYNCYGLTSITITNSVTSIGDYAFYRCIGLEEVILGSSIEIIGNKAFAGIERLAKIYSLNPTPPTCYDKEVFYKVNKDKCTLYVPLGAAEDYKSTYVWWDFNNIIEKEMSGIEETLIDGCEDKAIEYYNLQGVKVVNPSSGLYIKKQGNKVTKVVL